MELDQLRARELKSRHEVGSYLIYELCAAAFANFRVLLQAFFGGVQAFFGSVQAFFRRTGFLRISHRSGKLGLTCSHPCAMPPLRSKMWSSSTLDAGLEAARDQPLALDPEILEMKQELLEPPLQTNRCHYNYVYREDVSTYTGSSIRVSILDPPKMHCSTHVN